MLTVSTLCCFATHYACTVLRNMAASEAEVKVRVLESYVTARNNFFHWVIRWFYGDPTITEVPESEFRTPDFALLVCLLQTIGFDLHRFEKLPSGSPIAANGQEESAGYTINITSAQSGLHAVLRPKLSAESSFISNSGNTIRQGNVQDTNAIPSSLLPNVTPGTAHVARDVISLLMKLLCEGEQIGTEEQGASNSWTCPCTTPQLEKPPCKRRQSLETYFPIDSLSKSLQPPSALPFSDVGQMDFEDNIVATRGFNEARTVISHVAQMDFEDYTAAMRGSNEALASYQPSPILNGSPASQPELVRQKTWSIGSIHDLDDARVLMAGPTRTSSPVQSQQVIQNLEEMSLQVRDPGVTRCLQEACEKIQEAMLMLNSSNDKNVSKSGVNSKSKLNKQPAGSVPKLRPKTPKPNISTNGSSSNLRSVQRTGTLKRQRSPAPSLFHAGRKDLVTPKPVKRYATTSTPASTPPAPTKTQENEIRVGSFINISDTKSGSPKLSPRAPNSAPGPQICGNISPTRESRGLPLSRKSFSSLPASRSVSNLASGTTTPRLGSVLKRKTSMVPIVASTSSASASPATTATSIPKARKEGSKSILRPSLLKAPSIINRFRK